MKVTYPMVGVFEAIHNQTEDERMQRVDRFHWCDVPSLVEDAAIRYMTEIETGCGHRTNKPSGEKPNDKS